MSSLRTIFLLLFLLAPVLRAAEVPARLRDFDAFVARVQKQFDVPGIAVAIVKDGEVVLAQGYGVRELGKPERVDAHTLFAIASNTKAFTTASLAILHDQGKVNWDDRVTEHLPWFRMSDPFVTHEMRVRDLLTHRSGLALGAGDLLFWPETDFTTKEVVERLRFVPLETSFRADYAYDNILYATAGLVIEQVSGQRWGDFVRDHIFKPVGMTESLPNCIEVKPGMNVATGHAKFDFKDLRPVPNLAWDNASAAGGIYSNVHDLSRWVRVQLNGGQLLDNGGPLFQPDRQKEMWALVTPIGISDSKIPGLQSIRPNFRGYGLGWDLTDYRGRKLVSHTGGWPGQVSKVAMIPELKLGVIILTNQESGAAFQAICWEVLDAYLNAPAVDWVATYAEAVKQSETGADDSWQKHVAARDPASKPSLPLAKYAGTYRDPWRGDIFIEETNGKLTLRFSHTKQLVGDLEPWQHDTFIVRWQDRALNADAFLTFALTPDGAIDSAKMAAISPLTDFSFDFHHLVLRPVEK